MTVTVVEDPTALRDPVADFYARAELQEAEQEEDDKKWLLKAAVVLGAAFLVWRGVQAHLMRQERPGDVDSAMRRAWVGGAKKAWEAAASEVMASAYRRGAGKVLTEEQLYMAAMAHVELLGKHIYDTSSEAVREGFIAQLNKGVQENLAWQRAIEGMGLDSRQMRSYVMALSDTAGYQTQVIPSGLSSKVDKMLIDRGDRIAQNELWTGRSMAKSLAWSFLKSSELLPEDSQKIWRTAEDEGVCDICRPMDGKSVGVDEDFRTSEGRVYAPTAHPNCRCDIEISYPEEVEKAYRTWNETKVKRDREGQFSRVEERVRTISADEETEIPAFAGTTQSVEVPIFSGTSAATVVPVYTGSEMVTDFPVFTQLEEIVSTEIPVYTEAAVPTFASVEAPVYTEAAAPTFASVEAPVFTGVEAPPAPVQAKQATRISTPHYIDANDITLSDRSYGGASFELAPSLQLNEQGTVHAIQQILADNLNLRSQIAQMYKKRQRETLGNSMQARAAWQSVQLDAVDRLEGRSLERFYAEFFTDAQGEMSERRMREEIAEEIQEETALGVAITKRLSDDGLIDFEIEYRDQVESMIDQLDDLTKALSGEIVPEPGIVIFPKGYDIDDQGFKTGKYKISKVVGLDIQRAIADHTPLPHDYYRIDRDREYWNVGEVVYALMGLEQLISFTALGIHRINVIMVEPVEE